MAIMLADRLTRENFATVVKGLKLQVQVVVQEELEGLLQGIGVVSPQDNVPASVDETKKRSRAESGDCPQPAKHRRVEASNPSQKVVDWFSDDVSKVLTEEDRRSFCELRKTFPDAAVLVSEVSEQLRRLSQAYGKLGREQTGSGEGNSRDIYTPFLTCPVGKIQETYEKFLVSPQSASSVYLRLGIVCEELAKACDELIRGKEEVNRYH